MAASIDTRRSDEAKRDNGPTARRRTNAVSNVRLMEGAGTISVTSGAFLSQAYGLADRGDGDSIQTSPEERIAAAHAS